MRNEHALINHRGGAVVQGVFQCSTCDAFFCSLTAVTSHHQAVHGPVEQPSPAGGRATISVRTSQPQATSVAPQLASLHQRGAQRALQATHRARAHGGGSGLHACSLCTGGTSCFLTEAQLLDHVVEQHPSEQQHPAEESLAGQLSEWRCGLEARVAHELQAMDVPDPVTWARKAVRVQQGFGTLNDTLGDATAWVLASISEEEHASESHAHAAAKLMEAMHLAPQADAANAPPPPPAPPPPDRRARNTRRERAERLLIEEEQREQERRGGDLDLDYSQ
jgi:hypothetical protein